MLAREISRTCATLFAAWICKALSRCHSLNALLASVVFSAGLASAVMLNDAVCLLGTPLLLEIAERGRIPAVPFLLALATISNTGSAMTLTGNPQNIIIGHASGWGWSAFVLRVAPIVALRLAVNWLMLESLYRRSLASMNGQWEGSGTGRATDVIKNDMRRIGGEQPEIRPRTRQLSVSEFLCKHRRQRSSVGIVPLHPIYVQLNIFRSARPKKNGGDSRTRAVSERWNADCAKSFSP